MNDSNDNAIDQPSFKIPTLSKIALPILGGILRGRLWLPASGGKILKVMLGTYEQQQSVEFENRIQRGDVVYDIGASIGYYTLMSALLVGPSGQTVAFEPSPVNFAYLSKHRELNSLQNVVLIHGAAGKENGRAWFSAGTGSGTGHLSPHGDYEVPVVAIDTLANCRPPTHMKIDVEGTELDVLKGAIETNRTHRPTIFLSTHGESIHKSCCQFLASLDYNLQPIDQQHALEDCTEILCAA